MRPTRQLSCLLLREGEKLCNIFFFVLSVQSGDVQCVSYVLFRFSEKERMARQKRSRRNEPPQAMSLILCARFFLSKPQTLRWFAVWSPGDSDFPRTLVGIKASETKPCAARLRILTLCSSSCDADRRLGLHRRNRFGFPGSFLRGSIDQCKSVLPSSFCWQYGFSAPMKPQLLSDLIPI